MKPNLNFKNDQISTTILVTKVTKKRERTINHQALKYDNKFGR